MSASRGGVSARWTLLLADEGETRALGARLGRRARAGGVLCLMGSLGAGKTTFVQGFARGAGFRGSVTSPSFGIARRYRTAKLTLHHLDLYRLESREVSNLGLEEYLDDPRGVCLIEWPEAASAALPADRLELRFAHRRSGGRTAVLRARGPRSRELAGGWRS